MNQPPMTLHKEALVDVKKVGPTRFLTITDLNGNSHEIIKMSDEQWTTLLDKADRLKDV